MVLVKCLGSCSSKEGGSSEIRTEAPTVIQVRGDGGSDQGRGT